MSKTQRIELMARLAEEEKAMRDAQARGDWEAARDCETAYTRMSDELAADEE